MNKTKLISRIPTAEMLDAGSALCAGQSRDIAHEIWHRMYEKAEDERTFWKPSWTPLTESLPDESEIIVLLYHPVLDADEEYPGHPVTVSNVEYVRNGNAAKYGYTKWASIPLMGMRS